MRKDGPVLISWVALNNDPFERVDRGGACKVDAAGDKIDGPTISLLFDGTSPYAGKVRDVVLLLREPPGRGPSIDRKVAEETRAEIRKRDRSCKVRLEKAVFEDPTDHRAIYEFLKKLLPSLRREYSGRKLLIHVSPGTPQMQTVLVLMGETGFIDKPFELLKSYRVGERRGRPAVVPVNVGLETYFHRYKKSRPARTSGEEEDVQIDPRDIRSEKLGKLYQDAARFARMNVPVLLLGERGTGKTTLANWIRAHGPFGKKKLDGNWPAVPCGQYDTGTMRSELFGHEKGAFTGAAEKKEGLLRLANKDTLFLDEIGDLGQEVQRLLLKALEEKKYYPVGADKSVESDFRLLTATNVPWADLHKRLAPDFLDRISSFRLTVPPLRETREDLPWIWRSIFNEACQRARLKKSISAVTNREHEKLLDELLALPLPGNMRDLFRVAYRMLAAKTDPEKPLAGDDAIRFALEDLDVGEQVEMGGDTAKIVARAFAEGGSLEPLLGSNKKLYVKNIHKALQRFIARQARSVAKQRKVSPMSLVDVDVRTLRNWDKE